VLAPSPSIRSAQPAERAVVEGMKRRYPTRDVVTAGGDGFDVGSGITQSTRRMETGDTPCARLVRKECSLPGKTHQWCHWSDARYPISSETWGQNG